MPVLKRAASFDLAQKAQQFLDVFAQECNEPTYYLKTRMHQVRREIEKTGTYRHTIQELTFGASVAWRNASCCIGRLPFLVSSCKEEDGRSMHGIIFASWDRFLRATFGDAFFQQYRIEMKQKGHGISLMSQAYPDDHLIQALTLVSQQQNISIENILRFFGRYYIVSELTGFVCAALLQKVNSAKELLLVMADAHLQLKQAACEMHTSNLISPPIFRYEHIYGHPDQLIVVYQDSRQLCPLLRGAIEGAGIRYHERVNIVHDPNECMRHGGQVCRLSIQFQPLKHPLAHEMSPSPERVRSQEDIRRLILHALPRDIQSALTVDQLSEAIRYYAPIGQNIPAPRTCQLDAALRQLMAIGLVASTNVFSHCRYWKVSSTESAKPSHPFAFRPLL